MRGVPVLLFLGAVWILEPAMRFLLSGAYPLSPYTNLGDFLALLLFRPFLFAVHLSGVLLAQHLKLLAVERAWMRSSREGVRCLVLVFASWVWAAGFLGFSFGLAFVLFLTLELGRLRDAVRAAVRSLRLLRSGLSQELLRRGYGATWESSGKGSSGCVARGEESRRLRGTTGTRSLLGRFSPGLSTHAGKNVGNANGRRG
ncbi:MAG: hypothetical protein BLITH_1273 [Brockia lithotrophica]|uniref:Uncharacterized protein n=1 Tax=Brockia lithotrophica TaxID=933949 RepID=A0A2T5G638_9BACL|nr:MAG: hypothetical protein BLITH_1273 [Brockia lithotrophica]